MKIKSIAKEIFQLRFFIIFYSKPYILLQTCVQEQKNAVMIMIFLLQQNVDS